MKTRRLKTTMVAVGWVLFIFWTNMTLLAQTMTRETKNTFADNGYQSKESVSIPLKPGLADLEKVLLERNPAVQSAFAEWRSATERIPAAHGLPDPRISFGYFFQNIETAVGPQEWKIGITQMIPWLGKLIVQGDIQALKAKTAYQQLQTVIDNNLLQLRMIYYDYYYLEKAIDMTVQNINLVKNWEQVILIKYKTGNAVHANLIKTQIEAVKLKDDLETLKAKRNPLLEAVQSLINTRLSGGLQLPDSLKLPSSQITKEELTELILENNPEIIKMILMKQTAEKGLSRARMNYLPDFGIGVDYINTGDKWNTAGQPVPESGKDPLVVMGSINIPLWFYKQGAGVSAARHEKYEKESNVQMMKNEIKVKLESILFDLEDAARKVKLYRDFLIPKSFESLKASEKAYISDTVDFLNLVDAQRQTLTFQLVSEYQLVRYYKTLASLEALAGRPL